MTPITHCFVSEEDYDEFRRVCIDGSGMPPSYAAYASRVQQFLSHIHNQGGRAIKVYVKPVELAEWCRVNNYPVDSNARGLYSASLFIERERQRDNHD